MRRCVLERWIERRDEELTRMKVKGLGTAEEGGGLEGGEYYLFVMELHPPQSPRSLLESYFT